MTLYQPEPAPYPPIHVSCPNRGYALEMLDNLGGQDSEMSAVSLYFYNHLMTDGDLAKFFHQLSITEMHHLEIFGRLAQQLGADPKLWSCSKGQPRFWSPSYNQYPVRLRPLLENAINHEEKAIAKYKKQANCIKDQNIVDNLCRIIQDEEAHLQDLTQFCTHLQ